MCHGDDCGDGDGKFGVQLVVGGHEGIEMWWCIMKALIVMLIL